MNKLRFWRQERCLSQYELSALSGIPRFAIQLFEAGLKVPQKPQIHALSDALKVDAVKLFSLPKRQSTEGNKN